jgi:hypothetical protein
MLTKHYSEGELMMEIRYDGYEAAVTLRDDVWALEEPGTLNLSRAQAQTLRRMLNQLGSKMDADFSDEDG